MKTFLAVVSTLAALTATTNAISDYYTATLYSDTGCGGKAISSNTAPDERCVGLSGSGKSVKITVSSGDAKHNLYNFFTGGCSGTSVVKRTGPGCVSHDGISSVRQTYE